jgi:hypothetical protein
MALWASLPPLKIRIRQSFSTFLSSSDGIRSAPLVLVGRRRNRVLQKAVTLAEKCK